ncbi:hypothetical protein Pmar_PMAR024741 [Perkinsus marinus ATCC 50983]|uniref:Uncharacterized protein n=1 Tax=Perkinsus marinus (strain ATCC 50983 / TXsc) TaxID=423536 RepID=C5M168_PERM5|nr:hypothetical protein Pmar_PMAR024741 [Perkinsus marinus ATCC 50983]EEQ97298.1 hypothetical protein Pmar_PMAR024741 [Perkinsus marinus ATCC 50983]|eukprot:XP_002764581.1 hypothetical protein Pmar_PMAR024741 [Perkinsus marinus ATCC 50983]
MQVPGGSGGSKDEEKEEEAIVDAMECWRIRLVGDSVSYTDLEGSRSPGVVAVESLRWPGAATVVQQSTGVVSNIYVGYGLRKDQASILPVEGPGVVMDEAVDIEEQPEPFPAEGDDEEEGAAEEDDK